MFTAFVVCAVLSQAPVEQPPPHLREAFAIVNRARTAEGLPNFRWSSKLARAAQELTDRAWTDYTADPRNFTYSQYMHWELGRRMATYGVVREIGFGATAGPAHGRDGRVYEAGREGWSHPLDSPERLAIDKMRGVCGPGVPAWEGHVRDFHDGWQKQGDRWVQVRPGCNAVGLGYSGGMMSLNLGYSDK